MIAGILLGIVAGLLANELCEFSPWCARKLVRWSALRRYTDPGRAEMRAEELTAVINDRPGNLFKLITAVSFTIDAVIVSGRRAVLVSRGRAEDRDTWDKLVDRYAPLIWSICRLYRLDSADAEDVGQKVWLHLVDQLDSLRDPAALPGWLATTTRRECLRVLRARGSERLDTKLADSPQSTDDMVTDEEILAVERRAALRAAVAELPPRCQQLLAMLTSDPPRSYAEISAELGIPVGSIRGQRERCLAQLRAIIARHDSETRGKHPGRRARASQLDRDWLDLAPRARVGPAKFRRWGCWSQTRYACRRWESTRAVPAQQ